MPPLTEYLPSVRRAYDTGNRVVRHEQPSKKGKRGREDGKRVRIGRVHIRGPDNVCAFAIGAEERLNPAPGNVVAIR
jgi:hypothetical protein